MKGNIMIIVTDKNRDEIINKLVVFVLNNMKFDDLWQTAYDYMTESKGLMENEALESEVLDICPNLLKDETA